MAVGWKRSSKHVNTYVSTAGTTVPALSKAQVTRHDEHGNAVPLEFGRPALVEVYASAAGVIDNHNMLRQGELALEKHWKTHNWWIRVITTIIGISVVDSWLAWKRFIVKQDQTPPPLMDFVHGLTFELVNKGLRLKCPLPHSSMEDGAANASGTESMNPSLQDTAGQLHKLEVRET